MTKKILGLSQALTFDDILLLPGYTDFLRNEIDLTTALTKKIKLRIPLVSSPMDTVTERELAIALAKAGGIGFIHRNLTVEQQADEVAAVKAENVLAGAAIGASKGYEERVEALRKVGVDVLLVDSAHGYAKQVIETVSRIKQQYPQTEVIAGNVATYDGAKALIKAGADGIRVGMGPGSICSTRIISGMGVPQVTALLETTKAAKEAGVPVIADGGIKYSGDMVKALAVGASTVMMGSYFASAVESPGQTVSLPREKVPHRFQSSLDKETQEFRFKQYRGMGSIGAMQKGAGIKSEGEFHGKTYTDNSVLVAEGVEGLVPIRGTVQQLVDQAIGGIRSGMYYVGSRTLKELCDKSEFIQITQASLTESHPHDILVTNPGKNYI
ncbi:guanosine monophosphate reductase [Patescibacteria group bacterium]|nr:guanosine monophosphate reductase [Patescibacteria group bacterium]